MSIQILGGVAKGLNLALPLTLFGQHLYYLKEDYLTPSKTFLHMSL